MTSPRPASDALSLADLERPLPLIQFSTRSIPLREANGIAMKAREHALETKLDSDWFALIRILLEGITEAELDELTSGSVLNIARMAFGNADAVLAEVEARAAARARAPGGDAAPGDPAGNVDAGPTSEDPASAPPIPSST